MSLVNDMLRDLDRRGAGRPGDPDTDLQGAPGKAPQGLTAQPSVWLWLLAGVLLGAAALALVGFWSSPASQQQSSLAESASEVTGSEVTGAEPKPESKVRVNPGALEVVQTAPAEPGQEQLDALEQSLVLDAPSTTGSSTHNDQNEILTWLLRQAQEARSRDRLTSPAGDNAYDYYQQVLALEPGHPEAQSGLTAIARRYTEMAEMDLDTGDLSRARQLIHRGLSVEPNHPGLQQSRQRLEKLASRQSSDTNKKAAENRETAASPEKQDQAETGSETRMQVSLDAETRDRRAAKRGRELLRAGDRTAARQQLQSSLRAWDGQDTPPVQTTQALLDLYLLERDYAAAEALLQASNAMPKLVLHRLWAELEQARGRPESAIDWLESSLASAREDEHYRSLLARLYYTQGQQDEAAQSYSRLLADFGGRPAYWLGLGLARDAQDRDSEALEAFRRAQASGAYERNPEIADYLKRRIAALQRQTQASEP